MNLRLEKVDLVKVPETSPFQDLYMFIKGNIGWKGMEMACISDSPIAFHVSKRHSFKIIEIRSSVVQCIF